MFEYINPKKKHRDIHKACLSKDRTVCFDGGVRCGKTTFAVMGFVDNLILNSDSTVPNSNNGLVVAKTLKLVRENVISIARSYLLEEYGIKLKSELDKYSFVFDNKQINIYTASADNVSSQDSIQGMTIRVAFLDEAVLYPKVFIDQVFSRTDSFGQNAKIIMSTNPAGDTSHWYYKTYIKNADKYISITTEEAGIVDSKTIEKNRKTLGEGTFKQRYLAQWVGANNDSAFPNFVPTYCEERSKWLLNNPDRKTWQAQHLVVDTGFKDSVAIMEITQVNDLSIISYLDYHSSRETGIHLTSIDVVNEIVSLYNMQQYDSVLIDSNLDMVEQLRRRGVSVAKSIGGKDRERQWRRTSTLLNSGKLLFAEDIDKIIIEQIKNAKMDKDGKRIGKVDNNTASESEQIHALDCLVYYALLLWRE